MWTRDQKTAGKEIKERKKKKKIYNKKNVPAPLAPAPWIRVSPTIKTLEAPTALEAPKASICSESKKDIAVSLKLRISSNPSTQFPKTSPIKIPINKTDTFTMAIYIKSSLYVYNTQNIVYIEKEEKLHDVYTRGYSEKNNPSHS